MEHLTTKRAPASADSLEKRTLRVVFELEPKESCPFQQVDGQVEAIQGQVMGGSCHCDFIVSGGDDGDGEYVGHNSRELEGDDCICCQFSKHDCVPHVMDVSPSAMTMSTFAAHRDDVWNLLQDLETVSKRVKLKSISDIDDQAMGSLRQVDLSTLSDKQASALRAAIAGGYYSRDEDLSLAELAAEFDISKQALSQRLLTAEEKIMEQLFSDE
jgi:hypothetical protein